MADQTYALAQSGVYGQSNGVYTNALSAIPDSVIHRWPTDEGSGSTLADSEGTADATLSGGTWVSGDYEGGVAVEYDGVDDNASVTDFPFVLDSSQPVSYSFWIDGHTGHSDGSFDHQAIHHYDSDEGVGVPINSDGTVFVYTSGDNTRNAGSITVDDGNLHHVVIVYDQPNDNVRQYIDNSLDYDLSYTDNAPMTNSEFHIGSNYDGSSPLNAVLDDIQVHNEALTADGVSQIYNAHPST